jgi:hypothetical protein
MEFAGRRPCQIKWLAVLFYVIAAFLDSDCVFTETYIFIVLAAYEAVASASSLLGLSDARFDNCGSSPPPKPKTTSQEWAAFF